MLVPSHRSAGMNPVAAWGAVKAAWDAVKAAWIAQPVSVRTMIVGFSTAPLSLISQTHRPTVSQLLEGAYVVLDNHSRAVLSLIHDEFLQ